MATTTIRVDTETHAQLVALSNAAGASLIDTVRDAAEALRRLRFAHEVSAELADLWADPEQWTAYLADAEQTSVRNGLG